MGQKCADTRKFGTWVYQMHTVRHRLWRATAVVGAWCLVNNRGILARHGHTVLGISDCKPLHIQRTRYLGPRHRAITPYTAAPGSKQQHFVAVHVKKKVTKFFVRVRCYCCPCPRSLRSKRRPCIIAKSYCTGKLLSCTVWWNCGISCTTYIRIHRYVVDLFLYS